MTLFYPFSTLESRQEVRWKRWPSCFFARFAFSRQGRYSQFCLVVLLVSVLLTSCSGLSFGGSSVPTPKPKPPSTSTTLKLSDIHWCGQPVMVFRNLAASGTPGVAAGPVSTLTSWGQVKSLLGFTVYLPPTLPNGTCLVSASGTVRDPILGGSFVIGYILPDHSSLTLSQAPQRSQNANFQCSSTSIDATKTTTSTFQGGVQICSGAHGTTSIVFSASGNTDTLQQFFNALQPDVSWAPAS